MSLVKQTGTGTITIRLLRAIATMTPQSMVVSGWCLILLVGPRAWGRFFTVVVPGSSCRGVARASS